jgi:hypothetical protein
LTGKTRVAAAGILTVSSLKVRQSRKIFLIEVPDSTVLMQVIADENKECAGRGLLWPGRGQHTSANILRQ